MKNANPKNLIVWAVDPFIEDASLQRAAAWAMRSLKPAEIQPVYVFNAAPLEFPVRVPEVLENQIRTTAQDELDDVLKRVKLEHVHPLEVISEPVSSLREAVEELDRYARRVGASAIVSATHARKGLKRLFMGSFAETLMLYSRLPLILVNPSWSRTADFSHVIFPTDFSPESRKAFRRVLEFARARGARVTLFHKVRYEIAPSLEFAFSAYPLYREVYEEELKARQAEATRWQALAEKEGVRTTTHIDTRFAGSVADSILAFARRDPGILAMAARSGAVEATILGSVARSVVRDSTQPVWIVHPHSRPHAKKHRGPLAATLLMLAFGLGLGLPAWAAPSPVPAGPHGGQVVGDGSTQAEVKVDRQTRTVDVYLMKTKKFKDLTLTLLEDPESGRAVQLRPVEGQGSGHYQGTLDPSAGNFVGFELKFDFGPGARSFRYGP